MNASPGSSDLSVAHIRRLLLSDSCTKWPARKYGPAHITESHTQARADRQEHIESIADQRVIVPVLRRFLALQGQEVSVTLSLKADSRATCVAFSSFKYTVSN